MQDLEQCKLRVDEAYRAVETAKNYMKETDRRRFKLAFGSPERETADDFYQQAIREHALAVEHFNQCKKHFDDVRMMTHTGKRQWPVAK